MPVELRRSELKRQKGGSGQRQGFQRNHGLTLRDIIHNEWMIINGYNYGFQLMVIMVMDEYCSLFFHGHHGIMDSYPSIDCPMDDGIMDDDIRAGGCSWDDPTAKKTG